MTPDNLRKAQEELAKIEDAIYLQTQTSRDKVSTKEKDLINPKPVTVNENASVVELIRLIKSKKFPITYLPVVNNEQKVTGVITFFNLIKGEA
jgi:CBS domain-containing protein